MCKGGKWYEGIVDVLFYNMWLFVCSDVKYVVVFFGDYIYCMDYVVMFEEYISKNVILIIVCM